MPKISVIIPVYNVEKYIAKCLDSICNQSLKDIEIICINDCSTDNSLAILKDYASKDARIKIIDFKENKGVSIARNAGLKIAQGDYIGFVDSDDFVDLDFYESLYNKAIEDNADIIKAGCLMYMTSTDAILSDLNYKIQLSTKYFFTHEWWSAIYSKKMLIDNAINFPEECTHSEDIVFLNKCVLKASKLSLVDDVYYHYIRREDSIDSQYLPLHHIKSALFANKIILEDLNKSSLFAKDKKAYTIRYLNFLSAFTSIPYRHENPEVAGLSASFLISCFNKCKDVNLLESIFAYSFLLPYIKQNKGDELAKEFLEYNSFQEMCIAKQKNK